MDDATALKREGSGDEAAQACEMMRKLEAVFGHIEQGRMRDIPILNARLRVEAIGMRLYDGAWLSALITPWFINIMVLPAASEDIEAWSRLHTGTKVMRAFPAGQFEFICGAEEGLGSYQMCSLFSPVLEFEDQAAALATAQAALDAFLDADLNPEVQKHEQAAAAERAEKNKEAPALSRRDLLFGAEPQPEKRT
jgi:[NiFe] hydrogenase assembly HybE family chaperone